MSNTFSLRESRDHGADVITLSQKKKIQNIFAMTMFESSYVFTIDIVFLMCLSLSLALGSVIRFGRVGPGIICPSVFRNVFNELPGY